MYNLFYLFMDINSNFNRIARSVGFWIRKNIYVLIEINSNFNRIARSVRFWIRKYFIFLLYLFKI
jgi:hypothetical protein